MRLSDHISLTLADIRALVLRGKGIFTRARPGDAIVDVWLKGTNEFGSDDLPPRPPAKERA